MGTKSSTETVIAILQAFLARRTWGQAELARHVDVGSPALRKRLVELQESGIPLTCDHEHPHAYWSVPKTWFPGGVLLTSEQVIEIFRLLARLRKSASSQKLMERLLAFIPSREATALVSGAVVPVETTEREDRFVPLLEDSAQKKTALLIRYYSQRRGSEEERFVSVHRVLVGPPARFLATCHRSGGLKFFRVENVSEARESLNEAFRDADTKLVDAHIRASLDGFHEGGDPRTHIFFVQDPDARWVARNLIDPKMRVEPALGGIHVTTETSGVRRLARFVAGLGGIAKPLTPELAAEVERLARGALESLGVT